MGNKNITISVPAWLYNKMKAVDWVNWSAVARAAFIQKLKDLKKLKEEP